MVDRVVNNLVDDHRLYSAWLGTPSEPVRLGRLDRYLNCTLLSVKFVICGAILCLSLGGSLGFCYFLVEIVCQSRAMKHHCGPLVVCSTCSFYVFVTRCCKWFIEWGEAQSGMEAFTTCKFGAEAGFWGLEWWSQDVFDIWLLGIWLLGLKALLGQETNVRQRRLSEVQLASGNQV